MAFTLIAHAYAGDGGTGNESKTAAIDTTGADCVVVATSSYGASGAPTVTDSNNNSTWTLNTWSSSTEYFSPSGNTVRVKVWYAKNITTSATHYFRSTGTASYGSLFVAAFSGGHLTDFFDQVTGIGANSGTATLQTASGLTPGTATNLVIVGLTDGSESGTESIDGGFASPYTDYTVTVAGVYFGGGLTYLAQTAATFANPTSTHSIARYGAISLNTFKGATPSGWGPLLGGERNQLARLA